MDEPTWGEDREALITKVVNGIGGHVRTNGIQADLPEELRKLAKQLTMSERDEAAWHLGGLGDAKALGFL